MTTGARRAVLTAFLFLLTYMGGCKNRSLEQARAETREAKVAVQQLKASLFKAEKEVATVKAELNAVRQDRDELQEKIVQLIEERDQALEFGRQAQEAITTLTARASGQVSATAALEQQVAQLKALVEQQQALIEQLQKGAAGEPPVSEPTPQPADESLPPEPNEGL